MISSKFEVMFVSGYFVTFFLIVLVAAHFMFPVWGFILSILALNIVYFFVIKAWVNWYKKRCIDRALARLEWLRQP